MNINELEIHHIKYQYPLDNPDICKLLCHGCNHRSEFRRDIVEEDRDITASHKANITKHPIFIQWLSREMVENNYHMPKEEIIRSGAYVSGAHVKTIANWLKPLISNEGGFSEAIMMGEIHVFLKGKSFGHEMQDNKDLI